MQQRRLRPGDVLDDYCPRERRITDHAVVAMIDDEIKQTRCVSCDTEHEYKQGRVPPQRRKKASPALFSQVLDGLHPPSRPVHSADADLEASPDAPDDDAEPGRAPTPPREPAAASPASPLAQPPTPEPEPPAVDDFEGPVRRPLIRAQLPRLEGQPPPTRTLPDFTVRQPKSGRSNRPSGGQRQGGGGGRRGAEMQGSGGPSRFGGQRPHGHGRPGGDRGPGGFSANRADRGRGGRGRGGKKPR